VAPKDPIGIRGLGSASLLFFHFQIGRQKETQMLLAILVVVLILALVGSVPTWPHSRDWGYYPSGGVGVILLILLVLFLMGRL
jgi:hypothetical protein